MTCCKHFSRQSESVAAHSLVIPVMCCRSSSAALSERARQQMRPCEMFAPRLVYLHWIERIGAKPGNVRSRHSRARSRVGRGSAYLGSAEACAHCAGIAPKGARVCVG